MTLSFTSLCHYAECPNLFIVMLNVIMLSAGIYTVTLNIIMLSAVMLGVVAPAQVLLLHCLKLTIEY